MIFTVTDAWKAAYPGAHVGALAMEGVLNPAENTELALSKASLEDTLREHYAGQEREDLLRLPVLQAYAAYYRRFKKTYHVQLQLESIIHKGKSIPGGAALVEAMFMAEMKNLLLTAGHDLDAVSPPVRLDVARGGERYELLRGEEQSLKPGDMYIADEEGILSSIIYGPDRRSRITPATRRLLFTVYAPAGIQPEAIYRHLQDLQENVQIVAPDAHTMLLQVFGAEELEEPLDLENDQNHPNG